MRLLYVIGTSYLFAAGLTLASARPRLELGHDGRRAHAKPTCFTPGHGSAKAQAWFCSVKPNCNSLEVRDSLTHHPPPSGWDGSGYAAGCYALAGQIDAARSALLAETSDRGRAVQVVFDLGHPIADRGDDRAAGPLMNLVLEFWPENYQAMYHAGMSHFALGESNEAQTKLTRFLEMYSVDDFFSQNARRALSRIEQGLGPETTNPGAH